MTGSEDPGTQEAAEKSESADSADESPERSYRDNSKKTATVKKERSGGLEKAVSELNEGGSTDRQKTELFLNLSGYIEATHSADSDEDNDTQNGAVAIIYHKDKKTGELEFLFEEKPLDYPVPEAGGKLSLVGGAIQRKEKSIDALVRELSEELEEPAASIVIKSLDKYSFYQKLAFEYKGIKGYTDIYVIEIKQEYMYPVV